MNATSHFTLALGVIFVMGVAALVALCGTAKVAQPPERPPPAPTTFLTLRECVELPDAVYGGTHLRHCAIHDPVAPATCYVVVHPPTGLFQLSCVR